MRRGMGLERDTLRAPPLDVAPGQVGEASPAVGDIPAVQPTREIRDDETRRREPHIPQHGERVVTKAAIGVVERDEKLAIARSPLAANACLELDERNASPAGRSQRVHLRRETGRSDARDAKLATPFDLVITEGGRDHDAGRKPRAASRDAPSHSAGAAEPAHATRALLERRRVDQLRRFVTSEHQLRNPIATHDRHRLGPEVLQDDSDLAAIVGVDRTRSVRHRDAMP